MGNNQSQVTNETFESFNENLTNISQSTLNSSGINCKTVQNINFNAAGAILNKGCDIKVTQDSSSTCDLVASFTNSGDSSLKTMIQTALDQTAKSSSQNVQDFLSSSVSNQDQSTNIKTKVSSIIQSNFDQKTSNACMANATLDQNGNYNFAGVSCSAPITLDQKAQSKVLSNCITSNLQKILADNSDLVKVSQSSDSSAKSEQKGISDIVSSILSAYKWIIIVIVVGLVVCCLCSCGGLLIFGSSSGGQHAVSKTSQLLSNPAVLAALLKRK